MIQYILEDWSDVSDIIHDFEAPPMYFANIEILLAYYSFQNYSGDAFVLYRNTNDGKLYEVNGSHCSCHGLEGQWEPEETNLEGLLHRFSSGKLGESDYSGPGFKKELESVLNYLLFMEQFPTYDDLLAETDRLKIKLSKTEHQLSLAMNISNDALTALRNSDNPAYSELRNRYAGLLHSML